LAMLRQPLACRSACLFDPVLNITTQSRTNVLTWMALQTGFLSGFSLLRAAS
jgi:hypothetical protein